MIRVQVSLFLHIFSTKLKEKALISECRKDKISGILQVSTLITIYQFYIYRV